MAQKFIKIFDKIQYVGNKGFVGEIRVAADENIEEVKTLKNGKWVSWYKNETNGLANEITNFEAGQGYCIVKSNSGEAKLTVDDSSLDIWDVPVENNQRCFITVPLHGKKIGDTVKFTAREILTLIAEKYYTWVKGEKDEAQDMITWDENIGYIIDVGVVKEKQVSKLTINPVYNNAKKISGETDPSVQLVISLGDDIVLPANSNEEGKWELNVPTNIQLTIGMDITATVGEKSATVKVKDIADAPMNQRYVLKVRDQQVSVGEIPLVKASVVNSGEHPSGTKYKFRDLINPSKPAVIHTAVVVTYPDSTTDSSPVDITIGKMNDLYEPIVKEKIEVIQWKEIKAEDQVTNKDMLPIKTKYEFSTPVDTSYFGEQEKAIIVTYPDNSTDTKEIVINVLADTDGDGIPDKDDEDIDGDGFTNIQEQEAGSDPYDKLDTPENTKKGGGNRVYLRDLNEPEVMKFVKIPLNTDNLDASSFVTNKDKLPEGTTHKLVYNIPVTKAGVYKEKYAIQSVYPDQSIDHNVITLQIGTDAEAYEPKVRQDDMYPLSGASKLVAADFIINKEDLPKETKFEWVEQPNKPWSNTYKIKATYPDTTSEEVDCRITLIDDDYEVDVIKTLVVSYTDELTEDLYKTALSVRSKTTQQPVDYFLTDIEELDVTFLGSTNVRVTVNIKDRKVKFRVKIPVTVNRVKGGPKLNFTITADDDEETLKIDLDTNIRNADFTVVTSGVMIPEKRYKGHFPEDGQIKGMYIGTCRQRLDIRIECDGLINFNQIGTFMDAVWDYDSIHTVGDGAYWSDLDCGSYCNIIYKPYKLKGTKNPIEAGYQGMAGEKRYSARDYNYNVLFNKKPFYGQNLVEVFSELIKKTSYIGRVVYRKKLYFTAWNKDFDITPIYTNSTNIQGSINSCIGCIGCYNRDDNITNCFFGIYINDELITKQPAVIGKFVLDLPKNTILKEGDFITVKLQDPSGTILQTHSRQVVRFDRIVDLVYKKDGYPDVIVNKDNLRYATKNLSGSEFIKVTWEAIDKVAMYNSKKPEDIIYQETPIVLTKTIEVELDDSETQSDLVLDIFSSVWKWDDATYTEKKNWIQYMDYYKGKKKATSAGLPVPSIADEKATLERLKNKTSWEEFLIRNGGSVVTITPVKNVERRTSFYLPETVVLTVNNTFDTSDHIDIHWRTKSGKKLKNTLNLLLNFPRHTQVRTYIGGEGITYREYYDVDGELIAKDDEEALKKLEKPASEYKSKNVLKIKDLELELDENYNPIDKSNPKILINDENEIEIEIDAYETAVFDKKTKKLTKKEAVNENIVKNFGTSSDRGTISYYFVNKVYEGDTMEITQINTNGNSRYNTIVKTDMGKIIRSGTRPDAPTWHLGKYTNLQGYVTHIKVTNFPTNTKKFILRIDGTHEVYKYDFKGSEDNFVMLEIPEKFKYYFPPKTYANDKKYMLQVEDAQGVRSLAATCQRWDCRGTMIEQVVVHNRWFAEPVEGYYDQVPAEAGIVPVVNNDVVKPDGYITVEFKLLEEQIVTSDGKTLDPTIDKAHIHGISKYYVDPKKNITLSQINRPKAFIRDTASDRYNYLYYWYPRVVDDLEVHLTEDYTQQYVAERDGRTLKELP